MRGRTLCPDTPDTLPGRTRTPYRDGLSVRPPTGVLRWPARRVRKGKMKGQPTTPPATPSDRFQARAEAIAADAAGAPVKPAKLPGEASTALDNEA